MIDGLLLINKEKDWTSHDVVAKVKGIYGQKKVGHTGTLDPMAEGLLPICLGSATRLSEYISKDKKSYIVEAKTGYSTNTYDVTGETLNESSIPFNKEVFVDIINEFTGEIWQKPPIYSAIKYKGKKLYEYARKGLEIEIKPRKIFIYKIQILETNDASFKLKVECSSGTYIRSLIHDIGVKLGCLATMSSLIRDTVGVFNLSDSIKIGDLDKLNSEDKKALLLAPDKALDHMASIHLCSKDFFAVSNGQRISVEEKKEGILYKVYVEDKFIGIGVVLKDGSNYILQMKKVFR